MLERKIDTFHRVLAAADTNLDGAPGIEHSGFDRQPERRAVREFGTEELAPGIGVRVDVHHADRIVGRNRPENGVSDRMVAAGGDRQYPCRMYLPEKGFNVLVLPLQ